MDRPRISIPPDLGDYVVEGISLILLLLVVYLAGQHWPQLPPRIPVHLNGAGVVDQWESRNTIWIIPGISLLIYGGFSVLQRYPHTYNYLKPITRENAFEAYRLAIKLMRFLKMACLLLFLIIQYLIIKLAIEVKPSISLLPVGLGLLFLLGGIGWYAWKSYRV